MKKISIICIASALGIIFAQALSQNKTLPQLAVDVVVSGTSTSVIGKGTPPALGVGKPLKPLTEEEFKKLKLSEPAPNVDYKTPPPSSGAFTNNGKQNLEDVSVSISVEQPVKKSFFERIIDFLKNIFRM